MLSGKGGVKLLFLFERVSCVIACLNVGSGIEGTCFFDIVDMKYRLRGLGFGTNFSPFNMLLVASEI